MSVYLSAKSGTVCCRYEVIKKASKAEDAILGLAHLINNECIDETGTVRSGVVLCAAESDCNQLAVKLAAAVTSLRGHDGRHTRCTMK